MPVQDFRLCRNAHGQTKRYRLDRRLWRATKPLCSLGGNIMLLRDIRTFVEVGMPVDGELENLLKRVLLEGEEVRHIFWDCRCYGFFTDSRVIFIKETDIRIRTHRVESLLYYSIQRYVILYDKTRSDAEIKLYIDGFPKIRFYVLNRDRAFNLIELIANYNK